MRKSKKRLILSVAACIMALSMAVGGTMAYMTDSETATNTVTVGKVSIDLEEPGYPGNDSEEVKNIIPNQKIVKDPLLENTGNNTALVYLRVEVPKENFTELQEDGTTGEKKLQELFKLKGISSNWELIKTETTTTEDGKEKTSYVYAYKKPLEPGTKSDKLFEKVQMKNAVENDLSGNAEDIIITGCAIQATDIPDVDLTPAQDGTISSGTLKTVYEIFLNQSGDKTSRPANEGNKPQDGKIGRITYELNGGTIAGAKNSYDENDYGYAPPTPTKKGYEFTGWIPAALPDGSTSDVSFEAQWEKQKTFQVVYDANGGYFDDDLSKTQNTIEYMEFSKVSKTDNANEDRKTHNGGYQNNVADTDVITIPGTEELIVTITYATEGTSYDWVAIYGKDVVPSATNYNESISKKLGGSTLTTKTFTIPGDTVKIFFKSDGSGSNYYGYYATVKSFQAVNDEINLEPKASGKSFLGWYLDPDGAEKFDMGMLSDDVTVYAKWHETTATLQYGGNINYRMRTLAADSADKNPQYVSSSYKNTNITAIRRSFIAPSADIMKNEMSLISDDKSEKPIYMWFDNGIIYWWSEAHEIYAPHDLDDLCACLRSLTDISGLADWNLQNTRSLGSGMFGVFLCCDSLSDISPLATWNTSHVQDFQGVFYDCSSLADISALENWDTSAASSMKCMFTGCTDLSSLKPLKNWDTSNVTDMYELFSGCRSIVSLEGLENWDTAKVTDMFGIFPGGVLSDISAVSEWKTGKVTNMGCLLNGSNVTDLTPLSKWDVSNVTDMHNMFNNCKSLTTLNGLEKWDTRKVSNMRYMFEDCTNLTDASAINDWDIISSFYKMFNNCPSHPEFTKHPGTWSSDGTFYPAS